MASNSQKHQQSNSLTKEQMDEAWLDATTPARWVPAYPTPDSPPVCMVEPFVLQGLILKAREAFRSDRNAPYPDSLEYARAMLTQIRAEWYRYTPYSQLKQDIDNFLDTPQAGAMTGTSFEGLKRPSSLDQSHQEATDGSSRNAVEVPEPTSVPRGAGASPLSSPPCVEKPINQCDGCRRGLPLRNGLHCEPKDGNMAVMACTADRYTVPAEKTP